MHSEISSERRKANVKRDLLRRAQEDGVRFVRLVFADVLGVSKTVCIPARRLEDALEHRITFDGGSIDGFVRGEELDMVLCPDPATYALYPWSVEGGLEARLLCDVAMPDATPFEGCPRTTLRRAIERSRDALPGLRIGAEVEFYLFEERRTSAFGSTQTHDVGSYFDFPAGDRGEEARSAIVAAVERMGIAVAGAHHEHGAGQHEIDLLPTDPLTAADAILTVRTVAKHVAARFGLEATFMPKPLEDRAGSGLHVELRIDDDDITPYAVGGLLAHARALTAVCNPTVNSYKRLVAAWDAPIHAVWSDRSANALVRVPPHATPPRIELRSPDPTCNPYLALAVILGAATDGIVTRSVPGEPLAGSAYEVDEHEIRERGIGSLPKSLREAIAELDSDPVVRAALGDHLYHAFRDAKIAEYERYRSAVHPWEHRAYLRLY